MLEANNLDEGQACEPLARTISGLIVAVGRRHRQLAGELLHTIGLHPGQELMLQLLSSGPLSQREIAERIGVEPPTVTRMLQRLELAGLVERSPDARDARVVQVSLSAHGRALQLPAAEVWRVLEARTTDSLSEVENAQLRALLTKVLGNLTRVGADATCPEAPPAC